MWIPEGHFGNGIGQGFISPDREFCGISRLGKEDDGDERCCFTCFLSSGLAGHFWAHFNELGSVGSKPGFNKLSPKN
ncbi:hypothetical protein PanWU01x14_332990 [Parasponia andersonii]|uniref:Uncharacterized protein n=1 Tax=Parasponia andersonii TaxID=3476 RepID=A0A2P5AH56_PARAD|nr:hypothetical protein PanWU01x14_332990 [Parasponia andersonii]